jgi:hypothetical protein
MRAFAKTGLDPDFYAYRQRSADEPLPWEVVNTGVRKRFLLDEYERSRRGEILTDCREGCHACGILSTFGGRCTEEWCCPEPGQRSVSNR